MYWLNKLREFKKESNLTYKEISEASFIALTTVEKLFSGRTRDPKLNMISQIVKVLGHAPGELLEGYDNSVSDDEMATVRAIRSLDREGIVRVNDTIKSELCRIELAAMREKKTYSKIYYDFPVSAGTGEFLDERTATIATLTEKPPHGTDYILRISGNSMEPEFSDGDYVYVSRRDTLDYGEVGIFVAEGSVYMKEYTPSGLKSFNPAYKLIRFYDDVRCLGKVLGKVTGTVEI